MTGKVVIQDNKADDNLIDLSSATNFVDVDLVISNNDVKKNLINASADINILGSNDYKFNINDNIINGHLIYNTAALNINKDINIFENEVRANSHKSK